jgi:hypothetical protein
VTVDDFERHVQEVASKWAFVHSVHTVDKTDHAIKMRLHVTADCFIQVYTNVQKQLLSYALVLNRTRIYGRNCDGGQWHRHPHNAPETHDFSPEGSQSVTASQFLGETQQILQGEGIL